MSMIILDFGSGNSCRNDKSIVKKMYDELKKVDTGKHEIIVKWQLFEKAGDNIPLHPDVFEYAYEYGTSLGYKVTSSVFDKNSLDFLLDFDVPFVKIANNRALDYLIGEVPRKIPIYVSYADEKEISSHIENHVPMLCVSEYPAELEQYDCILHNHFMRNLAISDHTTNFGVWYRYQPQIVEWHYVLEHDPNNLDGGLFARTPGMLAEVL